MDSKVEKFAQSLQHQFGARLEELRGEAHIYVRPDQIVAALQLARNSHQFELLSAMTVVDYWPQETPRFHVVYQLTSMANNVSAQLRVPVDANSPSMPTATGVYEVANWREREIMEMFGIHFEGHPDPRPLMLPPETNDYPLRRDVPLGYEEPQFTFNFDEIDVRKPYAKE